MKAELIADEGRPYAVLGDPEQDAVLVLDTPAEAVELFLSLDRLIGNCRRCAKPLWLELSRLCADDGLPYCDEHNPCACRACYEQDLVRGVAI